MGTYFSYFYPYPWRETPRWDQKHVNEIKEEIKMLEPTEKPNILVFGCINAGKSSFINSILSIGKGRRVELASAGKGETSWTLDFKMYTDEILLKKYHFLDCMGVATANANTMNKNDFISVLKGHIKSGYKFKPDEPISDDDDCFREKPELKHQIHCVICVADAKQLFEELPKEYVKRITDVQGMISAEHIPRVLILTKVDELCDETRKDATNMFRSLKVLEAVQKASLLYSISEASIHPVKNYVKDVNINPKTSVPLLLGLRQAMQYAEDRVEYVLKYGAADSD